MAEGALIGWLFALVPALALARQRRAARRRSASINRALHELRRPLQALVLSADAPARPVSAPAQGFVELALEALGQVDSAVNGRDVAGERRLISCRLLVEDARERWGAAARRAGGSLELYWDAGEAVVEAEPWRLAQALDNLIANALEHGGPPFVLTASRVAGRVRISLADAGRSGARRVQAGDRDLSPRRGHGLAVVRAVAGAHGGRFALQRAKTGTVAALELPLAGGSAVAA